MTTVPQTAWQRWSGRGLWLLLLILPAVLYWSSIWTRFGLRDDYSVLREVLDEPGKIYAFSTSQGRPVYGLLLEPLFAAFDDIDDLPWARLTGALCYGLLGAALAIVLEKKLRWSRAQAVMAGALLALLPSVQISLLWGICWPHALAAVIALISFVVAQRSFAAHTSFRRVAGASFAVVLLLAAILIYQPNALFYAVLMAAGLLAPGNRQTWARLRLMIAHIAMVVLALLVAFAVTKALFSEGVFRPSPRVVLDLEWLEKIIWFAREPLDNALALFVVDDFAGRTEPWHSLMASLVAIAITGGGFIEWRRRGMAAALLWWGGGVTLAILTYAVSFVARERWPTYRTILPLSAVTLIFFVRAMGLVAEQWPRRGWQLVTMLAVVFLAGGAYIARSTSRLAISECQAQELLRVQRVAASLDPVKRPRVFVLLPRPRESNCAVRYLDEFGSLSADCDWCAKEMLLLLLKERYPERPDLPRRMRFSFGNFRPRLGVWDQVVDLRIPRRGAAPKQ
ncbi:MAG: hypothetical protein HZA31_04045 [Opitutae bacterium]|nr:hypothetical protein [Opitutae bacterium]